MSMFLGIQGTQNKSKKNITKSNPAYLGIQTKNLQEKKYTNSKINFLSNKENIKFVEGGNTTLYYLKTVNKKGQERYKIGITKKNLKKRYNKKDGKYEILMEKKIKYAKGIEKKIKKLNSTSVTNENLLGTKGTEIFSNDILGLDRKKVKTINKIKYF